jgi:hypothetical protein
MRDDHRFIQLVDLCIWKCFNGKLPPADRLLVAMVSAFVPQNPSPELLQAVGFEVYSQARNLIIDNLALAVEAYYTEKHTVAS